MTDDTRIETPRREEPSPFGAPGATPRARRLRAAALAGIVVIAVVIAWLATRSAEEPAGADSAHAAHGAPPAQAAQPVTLTGDEARRIGVTYTTVATGPLASEVRTVAQVTFDERRVYSISPKLDGWVEQLYLNETGERVRRGDPLFSIYSPMLIAAQQELLVASRLGSEVAQASAETRGSATELRDAARRRLLNWDVSRADVERIERTGEVQRTVVLRSPVSGVVVEKNVLGGQRIMAGDALYKIADLSVVWLEGEVFERDLPAVKLGQAVTAELQALPGESRLGRITFISPLLDPESRTVRVRVEMPNPGLALKPGMYATLKIRGVGAVSTVLVPRSAVLSTGERDVVFVRMADGMLEPREVTLGSVGRDQVQVLRGLRAGETVVASATFLVDAESNFGAAVGGMANMPGMEAETPAPRPATRPAPSSGGAPPAPPAAPVSDAPAPDAPPTSHEHE